MRSTLVLASLLCLAGTVQAFERELTYALPPGSQLRVEMKYGQLRIVGGSHADLRVRIQVDERQTSLDEILRRLKVRFQPVGREMRLEIAGLKNPKVEVEVPTQVHLAAHLRAGELKILGVQGDLNARLWAGELDVEMPADALYKSVRAQVRIGSVQHPFSGGGASGWLGKKYEADFSRGLYRLNASVAVGDLHITGPRQRTMQVF